MMRDEIFTFERVKLMGRPNSYGQPGRPQGLWSIASPVLEG